MRHSRRATCNWSPSSITAAQSTGQNLFVETASSGTGTPTTPGGNGTGPWGYIETSNVNVAELVNMIVAQRSYEMVKAVTTDQMLSRLTQL